MKVKLTLEGDEEFLNRLNNMLGRVQDLKPAMRDIARHGESQTRRRFQTETAPDGTAWQDSWRKQEKGGKTLTKDGHLRKSIASNYGNYFAEWGANREYAAIHQFGGKITPKNPDGYLQFRTPGGGFAKLKSVTIPARPFLPSSLDELDTDTIIELVTSHISRE
jgi:phage virion morphogenesis protein